MANTKSRLTSAQKIEAIAQRKRRGDVKRVSDLTGYSQGHVSSVLNGRHENAAIVNVAYTLFSKRKPNSVR